MQQITKDLGWTNEHTMAKNHHIFNDINILKQSTKQGYTVAHIQAWRSGRVPKECFSWKTKKGYLGDNSNLFSDGKNGSCLTVKDCLGFYNKNDRENIGV